MEQTRDVLFDFFCSDVVGHAPVLRLELVLDLNVIVEIALGLFERGRICDGP